MPTRDLPLNTWLVVERRSPGSTPETCPQTRNATRSRSGTRQAKSRSVQSSLYGLHNLGPRSTAHGRTAGFDHIDACSLDGGSQWEENYHAKNHR
jgi:hypothetical protein